MQRALTETATKHRAQALQLMVAKEVLLRPRQVVVGQRILWIFAPVAGVAWRSPLWRLHKVWAGIDAGVCGAHDVVAEKTADAYRNANGAAREEVPHLVVRCLQRVVFFGFCDVFARLSARVRATCAVLVQGPDKEEEC